MGDRGKVKWVVVWGYVMLTSSAGAQTGGYPVDPRAASKAPAYQTPQQSYPAGTSGYNYNQQPTAPTPPRSPTPTPARPVAPPQQQGYGARSGYSQQQPRAQAYVLAPPLLPYYEGADPPAGYVLTSHRNHGLMIGGGLIWAAAYGTGLVYAMGKSFDNGTGWLAAPIVGPWGAISGREFKCESSQDVTQDQVDTCVDGALSEVTSITFLAMMGMVQAVGVTLFFVGVGDTTEQWLRADLDDVQVSADSGPVGDSGYGFVLNGAF